MSDRQAIQPIKSRKDLEKALDAMRLVIQEEVSPLPEEGKAERIARGKKDHFYFFKTYFPHYCTNDFAPSHRQGIRRLEKRDKYLGVLVLPRDGAKTTVFATLYPIHQAVYALRKLFIYLGKTDELADDVLEFIRLEFQENPRLIQDFGEQLVQGHNEAGDFRTKTGMRFLGIGLRGTHRGWKWRQHRPDLIIGDDLDDDERVLNKKLIDKDLKRLTRALYGALDTHTGTMLVMGNIISRKGNLSRLINDSEYEVDSLVIKALTRDKAGNLVSFWPGRFSVEDLEKIRQTIGTAAFEAEFQNNPIDEAGDFKREWFQGVKNYRVRRKVQYLDPALGKSNKAAFRCHVVAGLDEISGNTIILDVILNRDSLAGMVDTAYALHERHKTVICGMEDVLHQKLLWRDFQDGAKRHGYTLPNKGISNEIPKDLRIRSTSGPIELGQILFAGISWADGQPRFVNAHWQELFEQYTGYPNHDFRDGPDATAGAVEMVKVLGQELKGDSYRSTKRKIPPKRRNRA